MMTVLECWMTGDAECCFEKVLDEGENYSGGYLGWRREVNLMKMRDEIRKVGLKEWPASLALRE
jgi:hypothetical protein